MNRQTLIKELKKKYPNKTFRTTEEFDGGKGGIWTSGEDGAEEKGLPLLNYYAQDNSETTYIFGVKKTLHNWLEKKGWYCEWYDAGTMMIWEI